GLEPVPVPDVLHPVAGLGARPARVLHPRAVAGAARPDDVAPAVLPADRQPAPGAVLPGDVPHDALRGAVGVVARPAVGHLQRVPLDGQVVEEVGRAEVTVQLGGTLTVHRPAFQDDVAGGLHPLDEVVVPAPHGHRVPHQGVTAHEVDQVPVAPGAPVLRPPQVDVTHGDVPGVAHVDADREQVDVVLVLRRPVGAHALHPAVDDAVER